MGLHALRVRHLLATLLITHAMTSITISTFSTVLAIPLGLTNVVKPGFPLACTIFGIQHNAAFCTIRCAEPALPDLGWALSRLAGVTAWAMSAATRGSVLWPAIFFLAVINSAFDSLGVGQATAGAPPCHNLLLRGLGSCHGVLLQIHCLRICDGHCDHQCSSRALRWAVRSGPVIELRS